MSNTVRLGIAAFALAALCTTALAQDGSAEAGGEVYDQHCATCHGEKLMDPGAAPDLRELHAADHARFETTVMEGRGQMPSWRGVLEDTDVTALWAYIRAHAFDR
jgi:mono/diheme cytochrome c family protein